LILVYSLLVNDFDPGMRVIKSGKGSKGLSEGERSVPGEFDASLEWETRLTILAQAPLNHLL
jgi:hypothetical protein